jgi:hypothetical protein
MIACIIIIIINILLILADAVEGGPGYSIFTSNVSGGRRKESSESDLIEGAKL